MKKLLIILGVMMLLSACCSQQTTNTDDPFVHMLKPKSFEYNGHKYIYFSVSLYQNGVVHDPECPCNKGK